MNAWHTLPLDRVKAELETDFHSGLTQEEARKRAAEWGVNELPPGKKESVFLIFLRQFASPLIYVLLAAAAVVFWMDEPVDAGLIFIVLVFNAVIGTIQEGKAQNTLHALRQFAETTTTVIRGGKELILPDKDLVPGDVIVLHEGEKVPADARLVEAHTLRVEEAALTGESVPVHKEEGIVPDPKAPLTAQTNMVFKGSPVSSGSGKAVVVATGTKSVIGGISKLVSEIDTEIPLKKDIRGLSRVIIMAVIAICLIIFTTGLRTGMPLEEIFAVTISLAVSIIPEGLPVVLTLILATGVWRMAKRNALIKKLHAVEALGQAQVIAVDKTGTLTRNEMVIRKIVIDGKTFEISGVGYETKGEFRLDGKTANPPGHPELLLAGKIAAFCANARVVFWEENKSWKVSGDPTEAAMMVFAEKLDIRKEDMETEFPPVGEIPFDYRNKYHLIAHEAAKDKQFVSVAGAPEALFDLATKIYEGGEARNMTPAKQAELEKTFRRLSQNGYRVVAFGYKEGPLQADRQVLEARGIVFGGFFAIEDSLRPEVPEAMARARAAGIKVVMITGDSRLTAAAIAKEAGIWKEGDGIVTDEDLERLSEAALDEQLANTTVFARITPEHKMKIIQAYKRRGEIVAMTGDGVNDAPPLVAADLGVAMGKIGTEVAKEAADIVLLDDNFGSIVSAVEEGRNMYRTIQKTILFLFSTSLGEVLIISGALFAGMPLPLVAAQILWLNLVTDSFVALALALDNKERNLLDGRFRHPNRYLVSGLMVRRMLLMALPMALGTLYLFQAAYPEDLAKAWTIALTAAAMFQWLNGWNCHSEEDSVFREPFANRFLLKGVGAAVLLQLFAVYAPPFQAVLRTVPLDLIDWLRIAAVCTSIILVEEIRKFFYRRRRNRAARPAAAEPALAG